MSLVSKICIGFILWTVIGAVLYMVSIMYYSLKGQLLDPHNKEFSDEYSNLAMDYGFAATGIPQRPRRLARRRSDKDAKIDLEFFGAMAMAGITWPLMLYLVHSGYPKAYKQLKDEYDRGIRTRKEKEVS